MYASLTVTVIVVFLVNLSLQHTVSIDCDSNFDCKIFNIENSSELMKLKEKISSGFYIKADETQINISNIIKITFNNSKFQELPEGFFNDGLFGRLKIIKLSGVGLQKLSLDEFSFIESLDISNNKLTSVEISGKFKQTNIEKINLQKNEFSCSYLSKLLQKLSELGIKHKEVSKHDVHGCNILGIECFCSIENQIDLKLDEIFEAFKAQDPFYKFFLDAFDNLQQKMIDMDKSFNETILKLHSELLSIENIVNICNDTTIEVLMMEVLEDNIDESEQSKTNSDVETDIIINVNATCLILNVIRENLTTKVDELAVIVTEKWLNGKVIPSKKPKTSTLWILIVLILIVIAMAIICTFHRISIISAFKKFRSY